MSLGPFHALRSAVLTQISAFGEHHQPHWLQASLAAIASTRQLAESTGQARSVGLEFSRHEYETGEAQTESYEGNVQYGFFEDDVDMAVVEGSVDVSGPPEVDPVVVKLRVDIQSEQWKGRTWFLPGGLRLEPCGKRSCIVNDHLEGCGFGLAHSHRR